MLGSQLWWRYRKRRWARDRGVVLMYHRVTTLGADPWELAVRPAHFAEHLEVIRRLLRPIRLDAYLRARQLGRQPADAVMVTLDDGYADNLETAKPLLAAAGIPATVFVTAGYLGTDREFWSDELGRLLLEPGQLPSRLELTIEGQDHAWELGPGSDYGGEAARANARWRFWHRETPTLRHELYRDLWHLLQPLADAERQKTLDVLRLWAGADRTGRTSHRVMTEPEVSRLAADGLVEVGSHTMTHPKLAAIPWAMQRQEIRQSKQRLEELVGCRIGSFAYPYGNPSAYSRETVALVEEAGYSSACITSPGFVGPRTSQWELPRIRVNDWDGEMFERKLWQVMQEGQT